MTFLVPLVMFGWIPVVIYLFNQLPAQRAVIVSFIVAWLFLPQTGYPLPGLPDYTKMSATCYGILLATLMFDVQRFTTFKLGWLDLPMAIWCLCPFASSMSNDLGAYDGLSAVLTQTMTWGVPYFLGRIYLNNLVGLRQLAVGMFIGGIIYVPLCLYEIRLSPQLHRIVYGFYAEDFVHTMRYGGFRPTVFMQTGLSVGMWMMAATLIGIGLWQAGILKRLWNIPMQWLVIGLLITFVLVKSTGAYFYLAYGLVILFVAKWLRTALPLLLLMGVISLYLLTGASGSLYGQPAHQIVALASEVSNSERASSLEFRLDNEKLLSEKARQKMIFGWGGWGRNRIYEENWAGEMVDTSVTDSLWILSYGQYGAVGLIAIYSSFLLSVLSFFWLRYPAKSWSNPKVAPTAMLAVVIILFMLDCALNAMLNPIFTLASGGIAGLVLKEPEKLTRATGNRPSKSRHILLQRKQKQCRLAPNRSPMNTR